MNQIIHIAVPIALIAIYIGSAWLWNNKYRPSRQAKGYAVDRFGGSTKRLFGFIFKQDVTPLFPKLKNPYAKKFLKWSRLYVALLIATLITFILDPTQSWIPFLIFIIIVLTRAPKVLSERNKVLKRMLDVANAMFHYPRDAAMNPWGYIQVKQWVEKTTPGETVLSVPLTWNSSPVSQDSFEEQFNQKITDDNSWIFEWNIAKENVVAKPVGHIPTKADYPGSSARPWNEIPLGVGAYGEIVWDVTKEPHALIAGKTGGGKQTTLSTPIMVTKKGSNLAQKLTVGDLEVGDTVYDNKGNLTKVTHLHPIVIPEKAYKVVFSDGAEIIADPEHLWYTETRASRVSSSVQRLKERTDAKKNIMLLDDETVARVEAEISNSDSSETISISEVAALVGKPETSGYFYRIAKIVGAAEEVHPTQKFYYNAQVVKQKQNLLHFNSQEFIDVFNSRMIRRTAERPLFKSEIDKLRLLQYEVRAGDKLTTDSLVEYLGTGGSDHVKRWIRANYNGSLDNLIEASELIKGDDIPDQIFSIDKEYINQNEFATLMGKSVKEVKSLFVTTGNKVKDKFTALTEVELIVSEKTLTRKTNPYFTYPKKMFLEQLLAHAELPINSQVHKRALGGIKTTQEIFETLTHSNNTNEYLNHWVPVAKALQFPKIDLPLDPYTLGAWLGDGDVHRGTICGIDHELAERISLIYPITSALKRARGDQSFRVWSYEGLRLNLKEQNLLLKSGQTVRENGSPKRIPMEFLRSSEAQRRALLAGLMDTDGTVDPKGTVSFTTVIPALKDGFVELVRTLGYIPYVSSRVPTYTHNEAKLEGKLAYTITFVADPSVPVFGLSRKRAAHVERFRGDVEGSRGFGRYIVDVVEVEPSPMRCIQVDSPSRLFLVGDELVATHNSVAQRNVVFHTIQHNDKWCFLGVDPKRVELKPYKKYSNTVLGIATSLEDMVEVIRYARDEMNNRYISMEEIGVNHFLDLPSPPRAIMLMVDEAYMLMAPEGSKTDEGKEKDNLHYEAGELIGQIARLGRASGVHLVLAMQRPDAVVLKGELKNNLDFRIAAGRLDSTPSSMVLDSGMATRVPGDIKGRGVVRIGGNNQQYQGYFAGQGWIDDWLVEKENQFREPEVVSVLMANMTAAGVPDLGDVEDFSELDDFTEPENFGDSDEVELKATPEEHIDSSRMDDPSDFLPIFDEKPAGKPQGVNLGKVAEPVEDVVVEPSVPLPAPAKVVSEERHYEPPQTLGGDAPRPRSYTDNEKEEIPSLESLFASKPKIVPAVLPEQVVEKPVEVSLPSALPLKPVVNPVPQVGLPPRAATLPARPTLEGQKRTELPKKPPIFGNNDNFSL